MKAHDQQTGATSAEETEERRADDLFWHAAVDELNLGPDLDQLEREARMQRTTRGRLERLEAWLQHMGSARRLATNRKYINAENKTCGRFCDCKGARQTGRRNRQMRVVRAARGAYQYRIW